MWIERTVTSLKVKVRKYRDNNLRTDYYGFWAKDPGYEILKDQNTISALRIAIQDFFERECVNCPFCGSVKGLEIYHCIECGQPKGGYYRDAMWYEDPIDEGQHNAKRINGYIKHHGTDDLDSFVEKFF